jgi:hypothetical protein
MAPFPAFRGGGDLEALWHRVTTWLNVGESTSEVCGHEKPPGLRAAQGLVHGDCAQIAIRIAGTRKRDCTAQVVDRYWMELTLGARKEPGG